MDTAAPPSTPPIINTDLSGAAKDQPAIRTSPVICSRSNGRLVPTIEHQDVPLKPVATANVPVSSETAKRAAVAGKRVTVSNPERHGDKEPFVVYTVQTPKPDGSGCWQVKRRFQDFSTYYQSLSDAFDGMAIVPPLPSKSNFEFKDKFSPVFTERRRKALERFLNRVMAHDKLGAHDLTTRFLSEQTVVMRHVNSSNGSVAMATSAAGFTTIVDTMSDALAGMGIFARSNQVEERFEAMKETCRMLEGHYSKLEAIFTHLYRAHRTMEEAMRTASREFLQIEAAAVELNEQLNGSGPLQIEHVLTRMSVVYEDQANALHGMAESIKCDLATPLHEYSKYCSNTKDVLRARDDKQFNSEELAHYLNKSRQQLNELRGAGAVEAEASLLGPIRSGAKAMSTYLHDQIDRMKGVDLLTAKQQKIAQIEKRLGDLEAAIGTAKETSAVADASVEAEMEQFEAILKGELETMFLPALSALHQTYFAKSEARWKTVGKQQ